MKLPDFIVNRIVNPELFVNRTQELEFLYQSLNIKGNNVLIHGERGIGKSSILGKLEYDIRNNKDLKTLPIIFNLLFLQNCTINEFLNEILLQICYSMLSKLYNEKTSSLLNNIHRSDSKSTIVNSKAKIRLYEIFRLLRSSRYQQKIGIFGEVGATFLATAKKRETAENTSEFNGLTNYEFLSIVDELNDIIRENGYTKMVLLCDEANHLTSSIQHDILSGYLEIFKSKKLQFAFVTISSMNNEVKNIDSAFEDRLVLKGFQNPNTVEELIERVYSKYSDEGGNPIPFEQGSTEIIFEKTKGNPRYIQSILMSSFLNAQSKQLNRIDSNIVNDSIIQFYIELKQWKQYGQ